MLYLNQPTDAEGTERMRRLTSDLIDLTQRFGGRFFLPYQLHYTPAQLERSYPEIRAILRGETAMGSGRAVQQQLVCALRARAHRRASSRAASRPSSTSQAPAR